MRFMVVMIPEVYQPKNGQKTEPDFMPEAEMLAKMGRSAPKIRMLEGRIGNAEFLATDARLEHAIELRMKLGFADEQAAKFVLADCQDLQAW